MSNMVFNAMSANADYRKECEFGSFKTVEFDKNDTIILMNSIRVVKGSRVWAATIRRHGEVFGDEVYHVSCVDACHTLMQLATRLAFDGETDNARAAGRDVLELAFK